MGFGPSRGRLVANCQLGAETCYTVNYVNNRIPSRGQDKTPYELFHGKAPDVRNLRVFECRVWAHVPGAVRNKMGDNGIPGTLMGCAEGSKAYRVLCGGRILTSRDVRFDEARSGVHPTEGDDKVGPAGVASIEDAVFAARQMTPPPPPDDDGAQSSGSDSGSWSSARSTRPV